MDKEHFDSEVSGEALLMHNLKAIEPYLCEGVANGLASLHGMSDVEAERVARGLVTLIVDMSRATLLLDEALSQISNLDLNDPGAGRRARDIARKAQQIAHS